MRPIDVDEYEKEGLDKEEVDSRLAVFITEVGWEPANEVDDLEENKEPWEEEDPVKLFAREDDEVDCGGIIEDVEVDSVSLDSRVDQMLLRKVELDALLEGLPKVEGVIEK